MIDRGVTNVTHICSLIVGLRGVFLYLQAIQIVNNFAVKILV